VEASKNKGNGHGEVPFPSISTPSAARMAANAEIIKIAKDAARQEILALSKSIAETCQKVIQTALEPTNKRFAALFMQQNDTTILVNALAELIIEKKGAFTKEELEAKVEGLGESAREKYKAAVDKIKAEIKVKIGGNTAMTEAAVKAAEKEHTTHAKPVKDCPFCVEFSGE